MFFNPSYRGPRGIQPRKAAHPSGARIKTSLAALTVTTRKTD
jgi:hypothetical protein